MNDKRTYKHTPGPWEWLNGALRPVQPSTNLATIVDEEGCRVFRDSLLDAWQREKAANKLLLAAAPDLLAACDAVLDAWAKVEPDMLERLKPLDKAMSLVLAAADKAVGCEVERLPDGRYINVNSGEIANDPCELMPFVPPKGEARAARVGE